MNGNGDHEIADLLMDRVEADGSVDAPRTPRTRELLDDDTLDGLLGVNNVDAT